MNTVEIQNLVELAAAVHFGGWLVVEPPNHYHQREWMAAIRIGSAALVASGKGSTLEVALDALWTRLRKQARADAARMREAAETETAAEAAYLVREADELEAKAA